MRKGSIRLSGSCFRSAYNNNGHGYPSGQQPDRCTPEAGTDSQAPRLSYTVNSALIPRLPNILDMQAGIRVISDAVVETLAIRKAPTTPSPTDTLSDIASRQPSLPADTCGAKICTPPETSRSLTRSQGCKFSSSRYLKRSGTGKPPISRWSRRLAVTGKKTGAAQGRECSARIG